MNIKKIKEIKHLLPQDCWIVMRNNVNNNEMDEEYVLHIEGDFETKNFDLGAPLIPFKNRFADYETYLKQNVLMLILVQGNFTANNVYNYGTDGSTGLMVLGNATVNNFVVGGQEIYIAQNLTVNECFWGHYNHGELIVHGELKTKVFIATEEYHYQYEKEIVAEYFIKEDNEEDNYEPTLPKAIFVPELIEEIDEIDRADVFSFAQWLNRQAFIEHLVANKNILQTEITIVSEAEKQQQLLNAIAKQFSNETFTNYAEFQQQIPNFKKLFEIARLHKEDAIQVFEWNGYSITLSCQTKTDEVDYILATHISGLKFYIECRKVSGGFLKRATETLSAVCKALPEQEFFSALENDTPKEILIALQQFWTAVLLHAERGHYFYLQFLTTVKCEDLLGYLATPVVQEKYNDYWDSDKNGFWYGDYIISVRINGARDLPGSVDIGKEIKGDEFDARKYYFRPN
ncbi:hypothetical protein [Pedobacter jamesrossensis]|uniref:DUF4263 domain-containing protein n=1 Tax=Pedobacter jamesrossensis TaxID=1908238 RepID=A0ABV8NJS9_9SPHI